MDVRRKPEELSADQRQRLHQAHQRVRNASHALEALTVVAPVRGRWVATPAPVEALETAQNDLHDACRQFWLTQQELLCWEPPAGAVGS
ncbi:MAG: hypothetical protein ACRDSR_03415 [Pseudonocardiaceae bacterium]